MNILRFRALAVLRFLKRLPAEQSSAAEPDVRFDKLASAILRDQPGYDLTHRLHQEPPQDHSDWVKRTFATLATKGNC